MEDNGPTNFEPADPADAPSATLPDTRPYTLAAAYLRARGLGEVHECKDARGFEMLRFVRPTRLRHWREEFYEFQSCVYRRRLLEQLLSDLTLFLNNQWHFKAGNERVPLRVTGSTVNDVVRQLRALCQADVEAMPEWLDGEAGDDRPDPHHVIAFEDGLLDYRAWLDDPAVPLQKPTPDWFSVAVLPRPYQPVAECPKILGFLRQSIGEEQMPVLQEWAGYLLTRETRLQKMMWLHGVGGGGKGTILRLLTELVGPVNAVSFRLSDLCERFTLSSFLGKTSAMSGETLLGRSDAHRIVEHLLAIVGEDDRNIDRKNRELLASVRLGTRLTLAANRFPKLPDAGIAMKRRSLVISFERTFASNPDPDLFDKLRAEMPGFTAWAMAGLRRLWANGWRFSQTERGIDLLERFSRQSSPVKAFVEECLEVFAYELDADGRQKERPRELKRHVYELWKWWQGRNGHEQMALNTFSEQLYEATLSLVKPGRPWVETGGKKRRSHTFDGVSILSNYRAYIPTNEVDETPDERDELRALAAVANGHDPAALAPVLPFETR